MHSKLIPCVSKIHLQQMPFWSQDTWDLSRGWWVHHILVAMTRDDSWGWGVHVTNGVDFKCMHLSWSLLMTRWPDKFSGATQWGVISPLFTFVVENGCYLPMMASVLGAFDMAYSITSRGRTAWLPDKDKKISLHFRHTQRFNCEHYYGGCWRNRVWWIWNKWMNQICWTKTYQVFTHLVVISVFLIG